MNFTLVRSDFEIPVVVVVFNRPELTYRLFKMLQRCRPSTLLVIADGPRDAAEAGLCEETRKIFDLVDWECDLQRNFADTNMGVGSRIPDGLDWVFEKVDRAIILEDDCLPSYSFFSFCGEMLNRYVNDTRVMSISGEDYWSNETSPYDYYFTRYALAWGWATWSRSWRLFHGALQHWNLHGSKGEVDAVWNTADEKLYWTGVMNGLSNGDYKGGWDYLWLYTCWAHAGLSIHPWRNLVSNCGFGPQATHTTHVNHLASRATYDFEVARHPCDLVLSLEANESIFDIRFPGRDMRISRTWWFRLTQPLRSAKHRFLSSR